MYIPFGKKVYTFWLKTLYFFGETYIPFSRKVAYFHKQLGINCLQIQSEKLFLAWSNAPEDSFSINVPSLQIQLHHQRNTQFSVIKYHGKSRQDRLRPVRTLRTCQHCPGNQDCNCPMLHQRPKEANGKRFGDFEMELIVDRYNHAILTVVERSTNMLFMTKLPHGKKSGPLAREVRRLLPYRKHIKTITTDNGPEFAAHKLITQYLGAVVYFVDPYASWQKGAVENTNKLIRQYIPKKANFDDFTDRKIAMIQKKINRRPRQKLNFQTPKCEFYKRIL